jgi:hypothetical protein
VLERDHLAQALEGDGVRELRAGEVHRQFEAIVEVVGGTEQQLGVVVDRGAGAGDGAVVGLRIDIGDAAAHREALGEGGGGERGGDEGCEHRGQAHGVLLGSCLAWGFHGAQCGHAAVQHAPRWRAGLAKGASTAWQGRVRVA